MNSLNRSLLVASTLVPFLQACQQKVSSEPTRIAQIEVDPFRDPASSMTRSEIISSFSGSSCGGLGPTNDSPVVGPGGLPNYNRGLLGKVTVPPAGDGFDWMNLDRFADSSAVRLPDDLYFANLNVPTRIFSEGFPRLNGDLVKDAAGVPLIEHFRIDFSGYLELGQEDDEGDYEFAMLADDGVRMNLSGQTLIESPEVTPTKMTCSTQTTHLTRGLSAPLNVAYFQGPRYHVALIMMWRKARVEAEPLCGALGNQTWFDPNQAGSPPTANYTALADRGWKVVDPQNFRLPLNQVFNPCLSPIVQSTFANP